ncbi:MAG: hypothetical protein ACE5J3_01640 [Methanosarcinales archaeon]
MKNIIKEQNQCRVLSGTTFLLSSENGIKHLIKRGLNLAETLNNSP